MNAESFLELDELINYLKKNNDIKVRIEGHTDNVGLEQDNIKLSSNRAKTVFDYLLHNEISIDRISYKGFGESRPINDNTTEEGRAKNRRTSFIILNKK